MGISEPFIRRPVGTTLLAIGLMLLGFVAYEALPVASLPTVEIPTIRVFASRPGADPETMAATVAAPLERRIGEIAGVTDITSSSTLGTSMISVQFELTRSIDAAGKDIQAALNAAATDIPGDLPTLPNFQKANPNATPILVLALTSETLAPTAIYDAADTVFAQRIAQVQGVAEVRLSGSAQPAVRISVDPARLAAMGSSLEDIRKAVTEMNALGPVGAVDGPDMSLTIATNEQLRRPIHFRNLLVKTTSGGSVKLGALATVEEGTRSTRAAAWYNGKPAVIISVTKQANSNVVETVDRIRAVLPEIHRYVPNGIAVSVLSDRTWTIRASINELQWTLTIAVGLVMVVVFVFLRRLTATVAAGVTVPLSLAATFASMWAVGYSIDNLTLMALVIAVGFVVDDAIVMIENVDRNIAAGLPPMAAALAGARQIGFTVVAISISLVAAFIPLLLMGGIMGRYLRVFSLTMTFAIAASLLVSLTVTPMIAANWHRGGARGNGRLDRLMEGGLNAVGRFYGRTLAVVLRHPVLTLAVLAATIGATVWLYIVTPKGFLPQDDTGLVYAWSNGSNDVSFPAMSELQQRAAAIVLQDPAVAGVASSLGGGSWANSINNGWMTIGLKPLEERKLSSREVVERLRKATSTIPGLEVGFFAAQDLRIGGRQGRSEFEFTLWSPNPEDLSVWAPRVVEKLKTLSQLTGVSSDREPNGLQAKITVDRGAAARLGVKVQDIESALNNAFGERQISTLYSQRNQYKVILQVEEPYRRDPGDLARMYVPGRDGTQVPLSAVAKVERGLAPLSVNHQGLFPAVTVNFGLAGETKLDEAAALIQRAIGDLHMPDTIRADFAGDAKAARQAGASQGLLILAALVAVYIVLGVLYESLIHPLTILSTLPAAGLGALLALQIANAELSLIAFIGIILLIGIVKKNGIILVDFALEAQRGRGLAPAEAIHEACLTRLRPILMTTLAALFGALPLLLAAGPGSELRRPLGITITGGLIVSQVLTLYTTPVVYLLLERLATRRRRRVDPRSQEAVGVAPAE